MRRQVNLPWRVMLAVPAVCDSLCSGRGCSPTS